MLSIRRKNRRPCARIEKTKNQVNVKKQMINYRDDELLAKANPSVDYRDDEEERNDRTDLV